MSDVERFPEQEPDGTPDSVPTKEPDATLRLTDDGVEMPDFLKGFVGEFTMRTPNVTGELETSEAGMPTEEFYDGPIATVPESGDYHGDLREGLMALSIPGQPETVFEIIDDRSEDGDAA